VEEVLAIVLVEAPVKSQYLVKIPSKEEWEEQLEATTIKEALVDIMEEMGSWDKLEGQDQAWVEDFIIKEGTMGGTLEDME